MEPGPVRLTVADLDRSLDYYERAIGLRTLERGGSQAWLGTGGGVLLVLDEVAGRPAGAAIHRPVPLRAARPARARRSRAGLAHALRDDLALTGASDHAVSEALYLRDPDLHGIEIYADRPRERWYGPDGRLLLTTFPLDVEDLLRAVDEPGFDGLPGATRIGPRPPAGRLGAGRRRLLRRPARARSHAAHGRAGRVPVDRPAITTTSA